MARKFLKLTRPKMRKLRPGESLMEHGIIFRREISGDGLFSVNIMVDRQRIHRVVGRESDGVTRTQAEEFVARVRTDARSDRLNLPSGRKTHWIFSEASKFFIDRMIQENGKNIKAKRRQLEQHLVPFFGQYVISKITSFLIEQYKKSRLEQKAKTATINRELAVLSQFFNKSVEWNWIKSKPAVIRRYKEDKNRIVYLTKDQCKLLESAASSDQNPNIHGFVIVGLHTGMRHSEILRIKIEHVDLERNVIWIPEAKAGPREQPITNELSNYLRRRIDMLNIGCPWLFPSLSSRTGHAHTMRKAFRRTVIRAGLDPSIVTPHVLRHTFITHLVQAGVDLPTVQRISGHKTLAMVARYSHQNGVHIVNAMSKLEDRIGDANLKKPTEHSKQEALYQIG